MTFIRTLLKNGLVLVHDEKDNVAGVKKDVLIEGNIIANIADDIEHSDEDTELIDCTGKIISPGFIDTHHHLWQTQLKGRHANELLIRYLYASDWQFSNYEDDDFFWGQLGGCLEALWSGTTTVLDHAHLNVSPKASKSALSATVSSGLRSIFGYCPMLSIKKWNPIEMDYQVLAPWVLELFEELAKASPFANGRVHLGLAFDLYYLPKDAVQSLFHKAQELGVKIITSHYVVNAQTSLESLPELLESYDLLDDRMLFSHANQASKKDAALLKKRNAHFSSTPSTEMQMALGKPICFDEAFQAQASLGIDCHSNQLGSITSEMRLGLQQARADSNQKFIDKGKAPIAVNKTAVEAFNLGTIQGARALKMQDKIGSLEKGKLADLVIFDTSSPSMVCAAEEDPIAAIVLHSCPSDIDAVMVDGIWRKRDGLFPSVLLERDELAREIAGVEPYEWPDVVKKLRESRTKIKAKIDKCDVEQAREQLFEIFKLDKSKIVDKL